MTARRLLTRGIVAVALVSGTLLTAVPAMAAVPNAPSGIVVDGERDAVEVAWTAPNDGGSPITQYTAHAYASASDTSAVSGCSTSSASATTCVIGGLTNGTTYWIGVVAVNADGTSAESTRVSVVAGNVPGAPSISGIGRILDGLEVVWTAPANDGGSAITGYTATAYLGSEPSAAAAASCSTTTTLECAITGLTPSTSYYVSVVATNAVGTGTPSGRTAAQAGDIPGVVRNVKAAPRNGFAYVTWQAPASSGNSRITRYEVKAWTRPWEGSVVATCSPEVATTLACNLGPLQNGVIYYVDVTATNSLGTSAPNVPRIDVTPATKSTVPRDVTASRVGGAVEVRWSVPVSDGGFRIHAYVATAYADPEGKTPVGSCTTSGPSCAITGLSGAPVYVGVIARTFAGDSERSTPLVKVRLIDPAEEPLAVAGSPRPQGMLVSWGPPLDNGGRPVSSYLARALDASGTVASTCTEVADAPTEQGDALKDVRMSCLLRGLTAGATYTIDVAAITEYGTTTSDPTSVTVRKGKPTAPSAVQGFSQEDRIVVAWTVPTTDGGSPIRSYRVQAWTKQTGGTLLGSCTAPGNPSASIFTCTLTGQRDFEPAWVQVQAISAAGASKPTARAAYESHPDRPSAPYRVRAVPTDAGLLVDWDAPFNNGGYPVSRYVATAWDAAVGGKALGTCTAWVRPSDADEDAAPTRCTIAGLDPDAYVYVDVTAENTVGVSVPSTRSRNLASKVS